MMYNLANELEREAFLCKAKNLACKQTMVELVEKRPRSLAQNAYLHEVKRYGQNLHGN